MKIERVSYEYRKEFRVIELTPIQRRCKNLVELLKTILSLKTHPLRPQSGRWYCGIPPTIARFVSLSGNVFNIVVMAQAT
ncbi:hypothetical protein PsorP6_009974 [Peronosclerospora sorghi]|uniref:Uncharacterized protein n=1 Tax=Peronosclerospora sorghi TaxID=230839 RepID=A0ACC0VWH7_9STRA|nr:hypothetical protein PsorP6_009974 [Peronosclerospora sorghi]